MFRDPSINTYIEIKGEQYFFTEAPNAPGIVYAEVGRKAKVYRLVNKEKAYALKVFKPRYRNKSIVENTKRITRYQDVMGLSVANRIILTPEEHPHIIEANSSFTYAVLMPWIEGKSWFNFVTGKTALQREESLDLARALVRTVNELEKRDLAHCDLSSSNFIFSSNFMQVELIDIEDLFGEGLEEPQEKPAGTGGYAPAWIKHNGIWEAGADRYSVGILISEIIGWQFVDIRNVSKGETFFDEDEFGKKTQRYQIMADKLEVIHPELSTLFKTVWYAESIEECPRVDDWEKVLEKIKEPELIVTPNIVDFGVIDAKTAQAEETRQVIEIGNDGGGVLSGTIRPKVPILKVEPKRFSCGEGKKSQHEIVLILNKKSDVKKGNHHIENALHVESNYGELKLDSAYQINPSKKKFPKWVLGLLFGLVGILSLIMYYQWTPMTELLFAENSTQVGINSIKIESKSVTPTISKSIVSLQSISLTPSLLVTKSKTPTLTLTKTPTNVPGSLILYTENFESGNPKNWNILQGSFNIIEEDSNHFWRATGSKNYPQAWYINNDTNKWTDYAFESRIRFNKGSIFICVRAIHENLFLDAAISMDDWIHIAEYSNYSRQYNVIADLQKVINRNKWYLVQVAVEGNNIRLYIDNQIVLTTSKSGSSPYGGIGYYIGGGENVDIDDIRVWSLN